MNEIVAFVKKNLRSNRVYMMRKSSSKEYVTLKSYQNFRITVFYKNSYEQNFISKIKTIQLTILNPI